MALINTEKYGTPTIEFGTGEVRVQGGFMDSVNENIGVMGFHTQKAKTIGIEDVYCEAPPMDNSQLQFVFTKIKSIEAIIDSLNEVKKQMIAFEETE